jgi:cytochrome b6-f complex iron-sulfur subunit
VILVVLFRINPNYLIMNRRESVQKLLLGGGVLFLAPTVIQSCSKDDNNDPDPAPGQTITLDLSLPENAALNNAGGTKIVQNVLIANTGANFFAVSSVCTHEGCTVGYNHSAGKIQCPCHFSEYSTNGSVLMGPALSPLESYSVSRTGNVLTIKL